MSNAPIGVILIIALALAGLALAKHEQDADETYQAARQEYEQSKMVVPNDVAAHRPYTGDKTYREEWRAEQDLDAQRAMAWWGKIAGAATCIGVVLLAITLWETTRTTKAAVIAAEQSQRSADIAERSLISSERPWLTISAVHPSGTGAIVDGRLHLGMLIRAPNFGKTPAIHVVGDEIVRSSYGAIQPKVLVKQLAKALVDNVDVGMWDSVIVPGEEYRGLVSKSLPVDEARVRTANDGTITATALVVAGVCYRSTMDQAPRYSIRTFGYTWKKDPDPEAPNNGISVSIVEFPGGSLMN